MTLKYVLKELSRNYYISEIEEYIIQDISLVVDTHDEYQKQT